MRTGVEQEELFRSAPVGRAVIAMAVPTVLSQLITVVYNMADTFFIGQLGDPNQVAAATLAMPVFMFLTAFANLFGIGGASMIARSLGSGAQETAKQTAAFCIWAAGIVALCYGIVVILGSEMLLPLLGTDAGTAEFCGSYLFWTVGIGAVPTVLNTGLAHLLRAEGYAGQASFGVAFGGILNTLLDPILIFVFRMEITGAAIATMLSNMAAALYFFGFLFKIRKTSTITPHLRYLTFRLEIPAEVLAVGVPSFLMTLMSTLSNLTLNKIISGYSNAAVAGMGIAKKIDLMAFAIAQGMTQGVRPLIGYNFSSGDRKRMLAAIKALLTDCLVTAVAGMALMYFGAKPLTQCFLNDAATVEYGRTFLQIVCLACPTTALNFLAITVFQATGKKLQPLLLSLLRKGGLDIPLMFLFRTQFGVRGIAWATPLADGMALVVSAVLMIPYLKQLTNQQAGSSEKV